jgi:hypothetical protein
LLFAFLIASNGYSDIESRDAIIKPAKLCSGLIDGFSVVPLVADIVIQERK